MSNMGEYTDEWLALEKQLGTRPILKGTAEEMIQQFNDLGAMLASQAPPPDPEVSTRDTTAGSVPIRIYTPVSSGDKLKNLPLGIYTHGGGFIAGDLNAEDPICRAVAHYTPCIIVSVDYRLGPKHKMPTMIEDSVAATKWAHEHAASLGADPQKMFTIGGSAGGALALMIANECAKKGEDTVKGVVAMVPIALHPKTVPKEYKSIYTAYDENAKGVPIIDRSSMEVFQEVVGLDPENPDHYVGLSKHLEKFPPTYIVVCGKDPLRDDGVVLEKMLREKGIKTKIDMYERLPHYFWIFSSIPEGQKFMANMLQGVKFVLGQS